MMEEEGETTKYSNILKLRDVTVEIRFLRDQPLSGHPVLSQLRHTRITCANCVHEKEDVVQMFSLHLHVAVASTEPRAELPSVAAFYFQPLFTFHTHSLNKTTQCTSTRRRSTCYAHGGHTFACHGTWSSLPQPFPYILTRKCSLHPHHLPIVSRLLPLAGRPVRAVTISQDPLKLPA